MSFVVPGLDWPDGRLLPRFQPIEYLDVFDLRGASSEHKMTATTIAGLINRPRPRVYLITTDDEEFWLKQVLAFLPGYRAERTGGEALFALVERYVTEFKGLIIYDPACIDSLNVATTMAGQHDGAVVSPALAQQLQDRYHCTILADLRIYHWRNRMQAYRWAYKHLLPHASSSAVAALDPRAFCGLRSFLVSIGAFVYWLDSDRSVSVRRRGFLAERQLMEQIYQAYPTGAVHLGWFIHEPSGVALTSRSGLIVLASDYCLNLEVWTALRLSRSRPREPIVAQVDVSPKVYVSFTMSDGDNLQYCQHRLLHLWRDPARGSLPIGWTLMPALLDTLPFLAKYYLSTATDQDELVAGPSGAGYLFPSSASAALLNRFLPETGRCMQQMGMTTLEVLDADAVYRGGYPLLSKISLTGMTFTDPVLQAAFTQALIPFGLQGILSGAGFLLRRPYWTSVAGVPLYHNLGLADTVERTLALIQRSAAATAVRPLFLNVYVMAWSMTPTLLQQVVNSLDASYEVVLPRTLLSLLKSTF